MKVHRKYTFSYAFLKYTKKNVAFKFLISPGFLNNVH